jgi:ABC-type uncharacterized transport system permease subunit
MGIPKVVTGVFKGILLFMLLAGETITRYELSLDMRMIGKKMSKGDADV